VQDNEVSKFGMDENSEPLNKPQTSQDHRKVSTKGGSAQLYIGLDVLKLSQQQNGIIVNKDGTIIKGNMHLARDPSKIKVSGYWCLNEELLTGLPSSIYTPIPVLVYKEPPFATIVRRVSTAVSGA